MSNKSISSFESKANIAFEQQVESLDAQTVHRLRDIREIALNQKKLSSDKSSPWFTLTWITGASAGIALAGILTFMLVPRVMQSDLLSPLEDFEILSTDTDMDLVTQLDFYQWLDDSSLSDL